MKDNKLRFSYLDPYKMIEEIKELKQDPRGKEILNSLCETIADVEVPESVEIGTLPYPTYTIDEE